jgi:hypothetical protein
MTPTGVALLFSASGTASGSLLDIRDPRGFVAATIAKSGVRLSREERDDLIAEGLAILCDLARKFEPQRAGYSQAGRFSGYAAAYLPLRLHDAYRQMHPTVTQVNEHGERTREFVRNLPLDPGHGRPELTATYGLVDAPQGYDTIRRAVDTLDPPLRRCARKLTDMLDDGYGTDAVVEASGLKRSEVEQLRVALQGAIAHNKAMGDQ